MSRGKSAEKEAKELEIIERGTRVIEIRKSGASFRVIAKKLKEQGVADVSYQTVRRDFKAAMKLIRKHREELAEEYLELQIERAESLMLAFWVLAIGKTEKFEDEQTGEEKTKVTKPSVSAAYLYWTIWRDLNDLLGFKAPQKVEHSGSIAVPTKVYAGFDPDKV